MEPAPTNIVVLAGAFVAAVAIVGVLAWVLRRFWRSAFGPTMAPAGVLAVLQVLAVQIDYAVISLLAGFLWWYVHSARDARPPKDGDPVR